VLVFASAALAFALATGDWTVFRVSDDAWESRLFVSPFRPSGFRLSHAQALAASGFCNALNGILIVYASPAARTPPLIQAVLQNCGVLFSVPFSKAVLGDTKVYAAPEPLRAAAVVVASVVVALAPAVADVAAGRAAGDFDGAATIGWAAVYLAGLAPSALLNVLQQLYFIRAGLLADGLAPHAARRGTLRALLFASFMQPLTYAALWWVDVLPVFGSSAGAGDFYAGTRRGLACSLGAPGGGDAAACPALTPVWAAAFVGAYVVAYFGGAALNKESATFNMLCLVVVTTATAVIWEIPRVNPRPSGTPAWSVAVSLVLSLAGSAMWKAWEARTPAAEQFTVARDAEAAGGARGGALGRALGLGRTTTFDGDSFYGAASVGGGDDRLLSDAADREWESERLSFAAAGSVKAGGGVQGAAW